MGPGGSGMAIPVEEKLSRVKTALILVFVAIDLLAILLAAIPSIANILSRIVH
jgi:uncharacterized membrane protein